MSIIHTHLMYVHHTSTKKCVHKDYHMILFLRTLFKIRQTLFLIYRAFWQKYRALLQIQRTILQIRRAPAKQQAHTSRYTNV